MSLFIPLSKADASQRLVYGHIDETPDRSGEVFDYASSRPHFLAWSNEARKATEGKSLGNIRAMHGLVAAGKVIDLSCDDARKRIEICAHIVDDGEWEKVEQGVYTGFSPGGRYLKRWPDGEYTRYTAAPSEISIVDLPCIPSAGFTMIKADGGEERVNFQSDGRDGLLKVGRRNSRDDQDRIQSMHDTAVALGACCGSHDGGSDDMGKAALTGDLEKAAQALAKAEQERDAAEAALTKAHSHHEITLANLAKISSERDGLIKRVTELEALPLPPKGALRAIGKEHDGDSGDVLSDTLSKIRAMPDGHEKRQELMKLIHRGEL